MTSIIAHRGASFDAPENTISSILLAWEKDSCGVEVDVHLTKDNAIVVHHDFNTKRTSSSDIEISKANYKDLSLLDVGAWKSEKYRNERIPQLIDVLNIIPQNKSIYIEIKCGVEIVQPLKELFSSKEYKTIQIIFICFDLEVLIQIKKEMPNFHCYLLEGSFPKESDSEKEIDKLIELCHKNQLNGLDLAWRLWDKNTIDRVKKDKLTTACWTVNDKEKWNELKEWGIDAITTDIPDLI